MPAAGDHYQSTLGDVVLDGRATVGLSLREVAAAVLATAPAAPLSGRFRRGPAGIPPPRILVSYGESP
jgi:hypothetical protein